MKQPAIIQTVFDFAIREINALEERIVKAEDDADDMLWEQAAHVVAQRKGGLSQVKLAAQWINTRTGEAYSRRHVQIVEEVFACYLNSTPRPRFRDAYNEITNPVHVGQATGYYEWYSPAEYVEAARAVLGEIDLDPASTAVANDDVVHATTYYTEAQDGLRQPWRGRVWLNPPYGQPIIESFTSKLAESVTAGDVSAAIVLVNNGTETAWFRTLARLAQAMCFPEGRLRFWNPDHAGSTPLQGQVVLYIGPQPEAFVQHFDPFGFVLVRPDHAAIS